MTRARGIARVAITDALLRAWPLPDASASGDKEDRGQVLVVGGSREVPGAVILAATAALRAGAGKLQIATVREVALPLAVAVPEARVIAAGSDRAGEIATAPRGLREAASQADALVIGPGIAPTTAALSVARALWRAAKGTVVLDAGVIAAARDTIASARPAIITPHHGEMAKLVGLARDVVARDALPLARRFARDHGAIVVLKSPTTIIASPDGRTWRHVGGVAGLGTSGSGDVLAGIIAGLVARGAEAEQAAAWGVRLHALAGARLARAVGTVGFLAREILDAVPPLMARLSR